MTQRRRELARRRKLEEADEPASRVAIAPVAQPATADLSAMIAHQEDLARELAVYRASGTRDQALDAELTRESDDLARHGRPFFWLAAAVLVVIMPVTKEDPFDLLPVILGSMVLALGNFAVRFATHARQLAARLEIAHRERERAERGAGSRLAEETTDTAAEALRSRTDAARRTRLEVERLRDKRDQYLGSAGRAAIVGIACVVGLVVKLARSDALGTEAVIVSSLVGLLAVVLSFFVAKERRRPRAHGKQASARRARGRRCGRAPTSPARELAPTDRGGKFRGCTGRRGGSCRGGGCVAPAL